MTTRKAEITELLRDIKHLDKGQKQNLQTLLTEYEDLFDGTLGYFKFEADFELKEETKPSAQRPYPVPQAHYKALWKEIYRLCKIGVLTKCSPSEWASPSFAIPKKNKRIRVVSDFHKLNKAIKRKPFPIPRIQETLLKLGGTPI